MTITVIKYPVKLANGQSIGHVKQVPAKGWYSHCSTASLNYGPFETKAEAEADVIDSHKQEMESRVRRFDRLTLARV